MATCSLCVPLSHLNQEEDSQAQSYKQPYVKDQIEGRPHHADAGDRSQGHVLYNPKANTETVKDCAADVAEHFGDEDVKLVDLKISRSRSPHWQSLRASTGLTSSTATSEAAIQRPKAAADLSCDAVTATRNDPDDFKATIIQPFVDMNQSWAEHKGGVESNLRLLGAASSAFPSTGARPPDLEPMSPEPQPDPYSILPPQSVANKTLEPDKFVAFIDLWSHEWDYSGELYDVLDDKVRQMLSLCSDLGIKASQFHVVFRMILTGRARTYYFCNVHYDETFATAYKKVKNRFDDAVNHYIYYRDWTTITFESFRKKFGAEHPGPEDLREVLESMLDKLQLCQRALGPPYAEEIHLRDAVLRACCGVPAFDHACISAFSNREQRPQEFFSLLRACLQVYLDR